MAFPGPAPAAPPLIIAGACGAHAFPANTLEAARACLDTPVDGIEIDVLLSADGHAVVHHDYRLAADEARSGGAWLAKPTPLVKDMSAAALGDIDVGRLRPGSAIAARLANRAQWDGARIPTFRALLALLAGVAPHTPRLYVELKTDPQDGAVSPDPAALTARALEDLSDAGYEASATIIAFDWRVLRLARRAAPAIATQHLVIPAALAGRVRRDARGASPWTDGCDPSRFDGSAGRAVQAHGGAAVSYYYADLTAALVEDAAAHGLAIAVWGVEARADVERMKALGAAAITVEGPDFGPF
jgi:glycerophosphoryl diester phosphodiesterase